MGLDKACAKRKHLIFGKLPLRPLSCAGDSSDCNFFFDSESLQKLRAGSGAGQRAAQHSGVGTEGQRTTVTRAKGPRFSSLQAAAGAEGQRDLFR